MSRNNGGERVLPRGRHGLTREAVQDSQRSRVERAVIEEVAHRGYHGVTIGGITARARVSRETFYAFFDSKDHAYESAYVTCALPLLDGMRQHAVRRSGQPIDRLRAALVDHLEGLRGDPAAARCFLVERSDRAGTLSAQQQEVSAVMGDGIRRVLPQASPFQCETYAAVVRHHVTQFVLDDRADDLPTLVEPIIDIATGIFGLRDAGGNGSAAPTRAP